MTMSPERRERRRLYDRERAAKARMAKQAEQHRPMICPECREVRTTPETLRVHRWLAHDIKNVYRPS